MKFINKRNLKFFLLACLVISIGSCKKDDFLNVPSSGSLTSTATFTSQSNTDLFVNDIYNQLPVSRPEIGLQLKM